MPVAPLGFSRIDTPLEAVATPVLDPGLATALNEAPSGRLDVQVDGFVSMEGQEPLPVSVRGQLDKPDAPFGGTPGPLGPIGAVAGSLGGLPLAVAFTVQGLSLQMRGSLGDNRVDLATRANLFYQRYETSGSVGQVQARFDLRRQGRSATVSGHLGGQPLQATSQVEPSGSRWNLSGTVGGHELRGSLERTGDGVYRLVEQAGPLRIEETIRIRRA